MVILQANLGKCYTGIALDTLQRRLKFQLVRLLFRVYPIQNNVKKTTLSTYLLVNVDEYVYIYIYICKYAHIRFKYISIYNIIKSIWHTVYPNNVYLILPVQSTLSGFSTAPGAMSPHSAAQDSTETALETKGRLRRRGAMGVRPSDWCFIHLKKYRHVIGLSAFLIPNQKKQKMVFFLLCSIFSKR